MAAAACLCSLAQRPTLIIPFMKVTTSSGCCSAISVVQVMTAGMLATWRVQSGYRERSSMALNLPVPSWRCWNTLLCV